MPLSVSEFVQRWKVASLKESAAAQSHFLDLCDMLGEPHPAAADQVGDRYTFEKHVTKLHGGPKGYADVWLRDHFAWEYKGKHKDLHKAYLQLADYREDLGNPPLLVVCDLNRFQVHTNFTSTTKRVYSFDLDDLGRNVVTATCPIPPLDVLRALFDDYSVLRPERTAARVTEDAAKKFLRLAERLELEPRAEKPSRAEIAHFLMRIVFCLFADSIGLLPEHVFRDLVTAHRTRPKKFRLKLTDLFYAMSSKDPDERYFGKHDILYFNGGLFDGSTTIELNEGDMGILYDAASNLDWSHIEPAIFGTLFERSLDADKRSLIGAHYTSSADILLLIEPVVMQPLRRRWSEIKDEISVILSEAKDPGKAGIGKGAPSFLDETKARARAEDRMSTWLDELTSVTVLDPACGSGNFLYIAMQQLLDLWKEGKDFALANGLAVIRPGKVSPRQLFGIETDPYAHELSSMVVWIGYLQWMHQHGEPIVDEPILEKLTNIERGDAILRYDAEGKPYEPEWPKTNYIVGNPPFLGGNQMRLGRRAVKKTNGSPGLGDVYVDDLRRLYASRVPGGADLVTYWFEKARKQLELGLSHRVGLVATNSIRMVYSRPVLQEILRSGAIFLAWSDRPWVLDGASVRISLIAFDNGSESCRTLDGVAVSDIYSDLTSASTATAARTLKENAGIAYQGVINDGAFELSKEVAQQLLAAPVNVNGRRNTDVVRPRLIGRDLVRRPQNGWLIDFNDMGQSDAALYELPFEYVKSVVKPHRDKNRRGRSQKRWWLHGENRPGMRRALSGLSRYIATPSTAKHRVFAWVSPDVVPDQQIRAIARQDDYFLGVLHSRLHIAWSLVQGSTLEDRPRYSSDRTFGTFPFPWPPGHEPQDDPRVQAIAAAAKELVEKRDRWLNPPDTPEAELKKRTLTNLYNQRPQWLQDAHRTLDEAVFAAYGWPPDLTDQQLLEKLLALNHERAAAQAVAPKRTQST